MKSTCYIFLACILTACNGGNNSTAGLSSQEHISMKASNVPTTSSSVIPFTVGGTYDSMSDYPADASSCLNVASDTNNLVIINPHATLDFNEEQSLHSVEKALGVNLSTSVGWGKFSIGPSTSYAKSAQEDDYTLIVNYIYKYAGTATFKNTLNLQGNKVLTPDALKTLSSPMDFRKMCGDGFVEGMDAGASVLFKLTLKFHSVVEKNYYTETLNRINGLDNILNIIESNPHGVDYSLTASGIQVGGRPELFNQLFTKNGGSMNEAGYEEINCGNNKDVNPSCVKIVNQLLIYPLTIESQLNDVRNIYLSNPVIAKWPSIGVYPGSVNPDQDILSAMQELTMLYDKDQYTYLFIDDYKNMLYNESSLSLPMQKDLTSLLSLYQNVVSIYTNPNSHIMDCYRGFVSDSCLTIRDNIVNQRNKILNSSPNLTNLLSYIARNRYLTDLPVSKINTAQCMMVPITESDNLYLINCNGQVSHNFNPSEGITIIQESSPDALSINNLYYSYTESGVANESGVTNQFNYIFNDPLIPDPFYLNSYVGPAIPYLNGNVLPVYKVRISKMFY